MQGYWEFKTRRGTFRVVPERSGRFQAMFEGEGLGSYPNPQSAAEELASGATFWPSFGDPSGLGIPEDLSQWSFIPKRQAPR